MGEGESSWSRPVQWVDETRLGRQPQAFSHRFLCPLPQVDHLDKNGQCALVHAALRGHLEVVKFLIQCDWTMAGQQQGVFKKSHAIQQALIAAASMGYTEVRKQPVRLGLFVFFSSYVLKETREKIVALLQNCHVNMK